MLPRPAGVRYRHPDEPPITLLLFASAATRARPETGEPTFSRRHKSRPNENSRPARHGPGKSSKREGVAPAKTGGAARGGGRQNQKLLAAIPIATLVAPGEHRRLHPEQLE